MEEEKMEEDVLETEKEPNTEKDNKEKDNRSFGEKAEDAMDNFFGGLQDIVYLGSGDDFTNDIPATMEKPSGFREINKVQTRRNINKRIFTKTTIKVILIIFGIGLGMLGLTQLISLFIG